MTGPKLNEKNRVAGSKSGSKASAKYVRSSASKARVVLNLVRDKDVRTADEILQFTDREMARVVRKVLASAVANATNNDNLMIARLDNCSITTFHIDDNKNLTIVDTGNEATTTVG